MNVSVLLRLIPASRAGGRLAGQAELVETGETTVFADEEEMLAFLRQTTAAVRWSAAPAPDRTESTAGTSAHQDEPPPD